jgi:hypothetical protein
MIQFKEEEVKAMLSILSEIPAKFSLNLIKFLEGKIQEHIQAQEKVKLPDEVK